MPKINKKDLLAKLDDLDLEASLKEEVVGKLNSVEELDDETSAWVKEKLQGEFDKVADELLKDDKDSPEYKEAEKEMNDGLQKVEDEFNEKMDEVEEKAEEVTKDVLDQLDKAGQEDAKDKIDAS